MENKDEEINKIIEILYEDLEELKVINKLLNNEIQSAKYNLYMLEHKIKKETTAQ